jgi:hypothetical protein
MTSTKREPQAPLPAERRGRELADAELETVIGGSQSSGAGAGKITFNPFSITRKIDVSSPG